MDARRWARLRESQLDCRAAGENEREDRTEGGERSEARITRVRPQ